MTALSLLLSVGIALPSVHAEEDPNIGDPNVDYPEEPITDPNVYDDFLGDYFTKDKVEPYTPGGVNPDPIEFNATDDYPRTSGWDFVGDNSFINVKKGWKNQGVDPSGWYGTGEYYFESTGGDIRVTVNTPSSQEGNNQKTALIQLFEYDGAGKETFVTNLGYVAPAGRTFRFVYKNASAWKDGDNGRAEFTFRITNINWTSTVMPRNNVPVQMED